MRFDMKKYFLGVLVLMVLCVLAGPVQAADFWKLKGFRISGTAGEDLSLGDAVAIKDADGEVYQADANDSALRPAVGIIGHAADEDGTVEIVMQGILGGQSSLAEGDNVYLSETAGELTTSAPSWNQKLGVAISTTEYYIDIQNYLDTSAVTALGVLTGASPFVLEGASDDAFETTVAVTDPTADNTQTLPDDTGYYMLQSAEGTAIDATTAEINALDQSDSSEKSTSATFVAKALYDVSGGDAGAIGAHGLGVTIPDNAVVLDGVIDVITTFEDGADDSATIAISVEGANDIVTATAISGGSDIWDAGLQDVVPDGTAANMVKTTSAQEITATVADDALSAGKMWIILRYTITE